jgi:hypothetical protein
MTELLTFVKSHIPAGIWTVVAISIISLIIFILKNPEKIDKWSELYYKYIGIWEKNRRKKIVSSELSYRITYLAKEFNKQSSGIMPFGLRIRWTTSEEVSSSVQNDEVILVLKETANSEKNIVDAFLAFTPKALLPKGRISVDQTLLHLLDIYTIKKMLFTGNYSSAYNYFLSNIVDPEVASGGIDGQKLDGLQKSDEKGFYARVLLSELKSLSDRVFGTSEERAYLQETMEFFSFVCGLATRNPGENTPLLFVGRLIKIGIVFVAKRDTVKSYFGLDSYVHRTQLDFEQGALKVFIFAHALVEEESEVDSEGYVVRVTRRATFKYMDYIEKQILQDSNLRLVRTECFPVEMRGSMKQTKLLVVEKLDPALPGI